MESVIERAMNINNQALPARITDKITDWLNFYCLVTIFRVLILVFDAQFSVVENYEGKRLLLVLVLLASKPSVYRLFTYTLFHTNWMHLIFLSSVGEYTII